MTTTDSPTRPGLPMACLYRPHLRLFQVTRCKGKSLANRGVGFLRSRDPPPSKQEEELRAEAADEGEEGEAEKEGSTKEATTTEFLYIEEVIFLFERGLMEVWTEEPLGSSEPNGHPDDATTTPPRPAIWLDAYQLYQLLEPCGLSLASYLVYAHLCNQTFRVLRHSPPRRQILDEMQQLAEPRLEITAHVAAHHHQPGESPTAASNSEDEDENDHEEENEETIGRPHHNHDSLRARELKQLLRQDLASAPPPTVYSPGSGPPTVAWDVYLPNAQFARSRPGPPAFYCAATYLAPSGLTFDHLWQLMQDHHHPAGPLKLATVSDAGTVVLFGLTDSGVPALTTTERGGGGPAAG